VKQPVHKPRKLYHLGIYGVDMKLIFSSLSNSLRESVRLAGLHVADMDHYQRVYRELLRQPAVFTSAYQRLPPSGVSSTEKQPGCIVLLMSEVSTGTDFVFPPILGGTPSSASGSTS
jgi:hypothetical protein